jgi:cell division protein ZapE
MAAGPAQAYRGLIASGAIKGDAHQARTVESLQRLHDALGGYRPGQRELLGLGAPVAPPRGLYIHGPVGRGKSMLMDLFFSVAPIRAKRRVHFHAFMAETQRALHEWRGLSEKERVRRPNFVKGAGDDPISPVAAAIAKQAMLLCFDEFQVADIADAMILGRLFEALFARGVVAVATSNRAPEDLYENGINRQLFLPFVDLIRSRMDVLALDGPIDYRLARLKGAQVYFTPLGKAANERLAAAWRDLTGMAKGEPCELPVLGRKLSVPEQAKGVSRWTFAQLCEAPLSPPDYLALTQAFHALAIADIPLMGADARDASRRFVTLIDTAYEAQVKIVCSAAAMPAALFSAASKNTETARAASRLEEMQSADYLAKPHRPMAAAA